MVAAWAGPGAARHGGLTDGAPGRSLGLPGRGGAGGTPGSPAPVIPVLQRTFHCDQGQEWAESKVKISTLTSYGLGW